MGNGKPSSEESSKQKLLKIMMVVGWVVGLDINSMTCGISEEVFIIK